MNVWSKRVVWFFGYATMLTTWQITDYITQNTTIINGDSGLIILLGWFLPLIFMEDDKKK